MKLTSSVVYPNNCMVPSMATGLRDHVTFLTEEVPPRVASCGGWDDDHSNWRERSKKCLVLASGNWSTGLIDNLPDKRMNSASARLDEGVFLLGGRYTRSTSVFLPAGTRSWVSGPELPVTMRNGPCAAPISGRSFLIVYGKQVLEFDTEVAGPRSSAGWRPRGKWPQMQVERTYQPGCAVLKTKFIVAGGSNDVDGTLKSTEIIDLEQGTTYFASDMQRERSNFNFFVMSGNLYAFGGYNCVGGCHSLADVEEFVEDTESWKLADKNLPGGRSSYGGVAVNGDLVCG